MAPAHLDFDASHAPKNCNDVENFRLILSAMVPRTFLRDDAERRLIVRIYWSRTGGKRADVSLVDAQGATVAERHHDYSATAECHKLLWNVAYDAAKFLGAFEPPPLKEPVACPASPPSVPCPPTRPCPMCPSLVPPTPTITLLPAPYRSFIGFGAFVGSGIFSEVGGGPYLWLGYVPSRRWSDLHLEFEAAWTSQTSESIRVHSIPLVGSLCLVRGIVRFCGGLATTILNSNQSSAHDELRLMLGANFRVGTELFARGPFSIRADVFGRLGFAQRRFGKATLGIDDPNLFAGGLAVTGVCSFN